MIGFFIFLIALALLITVTIYQWIRGLCKKRFNYAFKKTINRNRWVIHLIAIMYVMVGGSYIIEPINKWVGSQTQDITKLGSVSV